MSTVNLSSPAHKLLGAALLAVLWCTGAVLLALSQPWMGLTLEADLQAGTVTVVHGEGPSSQLPVPARLLAISAPEHPRVVISATALVEDPDLFQTYEQLDGFLAEQSRLARILATGSVRLEVIGQEGEPRSFTLSPEARRPLRSLPPVFWFQLFAGSAGFLIGAWVFVLRSRDVAVRMFGVMSMMFPLFTVTAAVYSTRELALDGGLIRTLSALNQTGASLFGNGLVALFLSYPRQLVRPRWLWAVPAVFVTWLLANLFRLTPDQEWGAQLPILSEMLLALGCAVVQWRVTRGDPRAQASLQWFGLSILVGASLFVFTRVGSTLLGGIPPIAQGYSFGFFLLMDVGLALGLRRFRLFELDEWAYRILFWVGGALALLLLDAALAVLLQLEASSSLGLAVLLCGLGYLPLRNWLWSRLVSRRQLSDQQLFQALLEVAFAPAGEQRAERWKALVRRLFDPLTLEPVADEVRQVQLQQDGLELLLPPSASAPALRAAYPFKGRTLFGPQHLRLGEYLVELMRQIEASRDAYDRGVREERLRIARDLHDDVGARLLTALHQDALDRTRQSIRLAIADIRSIVSALTGRLIPAADVLADIRHETSQRLEAAGIELEWPIPPAEPDGAELSHHVSRQLVSMTREAISNVIRHARARKVEVTSQCGKEGLLLTIRDDGAGFDESAGSGEGLRNLKQRGEEAGGEVRIESGPSRTLLEFRLPVQERLYAGAERGHA